MQTISTYRCIAYGGASAACPPGHTMEALRKAIELGAGMLYVEVRITRDHEILVWPSMQRLLYDNPVHLSDYHLTDWRRLTEFDPAPVATIDEAIALAAQTGCGLAVEIRAGGVEMPLARKLRSSGIPYRSLLVVCVTSASHTIMRSLDPHIPLAHRFHMDHHAKITGDLLMRLDAEAVFWPANVLRQDLVKRIKSKGIAVYAGPVNLWQEMRRQLDHIGVDGILTPYPDVMLHDPRLTDWKKEAA